MGAIGRGTLMLYQKQRTPGSVKFRTGGYSPRPGRFQRPVDQVKLLDRRLKSGWEAVRGERAFGRAAVSVRPAGRMRPASSPVSSLVHSVVIDSPGVRAPRGRTREVFTGI